MMNKYSKKQKTFMLVIFLILMLLSILLGKDISMSEQWVFFDALRTTSSIVFAVIGAWFAIVYPERLRFKKTPKDYNRSESETNFDRFFLPLIASSLILITILAISIIIPLAKTIPFFVELKHVGRTFSYTLLSFMTLVQIWSIFEIIILSDTIKSIADESDAKEDLKNKINKSGTTLSKEQINQVKIEDIIK